MQKEKAAEKAAFPFCCCSGLESEVNRHLGTTRSAAAQVRVAATHVGRRSGGQILCSINGWVGSSFQAVA